MSAVAQARHGFRTVSLDVDDVAADTWRQVAVEDRKTAIPDLAAFRIDFARWLGTLADRDRRIVGAFVSGAGTSDVAERFGCTPARVSQLRRKYEQSWRAFQGDAA